MSCLPSYPLVHSLPWQDPAALFSLFANESGAIFFDSAQQMAEYGRYSFIGIEPFSVLSSKDENIYLNNETFTGNPFAVLKKQLALYSLPVLPDLPPFQGGAAGFFGYDLAHHLEHIPYPKSTNTIADLWLGFYDLVLAFDHEKKCAFIFSSGLPEKNPEARQQRAVDRLEDLLKKLNNKNTDSATHLSVISPEKISSNFTQPEYQQAIKKVIDYIYAGDIFQANIAQRFTAPLENGEPFSLYLHLRAINPAPFAAYLKTDHVILASASPERFIQLQQNKITTCPIKGTSPRAQDAEQDLAFANALLSSAKDRSENIMIVDLLRNDLSRVCKADSVIVTKLCALEKFSSVHHLVSVIEGELDAEKTAVDLLCATFPGGSITGAPKIRAMEIIAKIEPHARGPYCGSIGYIGFNGDMDTSITIRTFVIHDDKVHFNAGGGIVADSEPEKEFQETLLKARALRRALTEKTSI